MWCNSGVASWSLNHISDLDNNKIYTAKGAQDSFITHVITIWKVIENRENYGAEVSRFKTFDCFQTYSWGNIFLSPKLAAPSWNLVTRAHIEQHRDSPQSQRSWQHKYLRIKIWNCVNEEIQVTLVITELVIPFGAYRKPKRPKTEQIRQLTGEIIGYSVRYPVSGSAKMVWHARQNHSPSVVTSPDRLS